MTKLESLMVFQTSDGQFWVLKQEALDHQTKLDIEAYLMEHPIFWGDDEVDAKLISEWLLKHRTFITQIWEENS